MLKISLVRKNRIKIETARLNYENNTIDREIDMKNIYTHPCRAHLIVIYNGLSVLAL